MARKDKYACFQWIRDVRAKMSAEMEHMTPDERVAYIHAGAQEALRGLPKLDPAEAERQLHDILYPKDAPAPAPKPKVAKKPAKPRKTAKRLTQV